MVKPLRSPKDSENDPPRRPGNRPITKEDLNELEHKLNKILMNQAELAAGLRTIQTQVGKVATEQATRFDSLSAKITELEAIIAAGGDVTEEVTTALDGVKVALQALDDTIPDAPPVEPPTP